MNTAHDAPTITAAQIEAGQAVYTRFSLAFYDWLVLGFTNRFIWRCRTAEILALYDANITDNHLDVGVGTGYYLDRCRFPSERPRLALMDLNADCLTVAAKCVARYAPEILRANVLSPIAIETAPFASVGLSYLLHCLPGTMRGKAAVFENLKPLLAPGGTVFGATLLSDGVDRSWAARRLMALYNAKGIFSNSDDRLADLEAVLAAAFPDYEIRTVGCVALFHARLGDAPGN